MLQAEFPEADIRRHPTTNKRYIPVEKIDAISKFSGKEGVVPKVNSLGSSEWHKTKMRVTDKVKNIAKELLRIYAEREIKKGFQFAKDDELQTQYAYYIQNQLASLTAKENESK